MIIEEIGWGPLKNKVDVSLLKSSEKMGLKNRFRKTFTPGWTCI